MRAWGTRNSAEGPNFETAAVVLQVCSHPSESLFLSLQIGGFLLTTNSSYRRAVKAWVQKVLFFVAVAVAGR